MKFKNFTVLISLFMFSSCGNPNSKPTESRKSVVNDSLGNLQGLEQSALASKKITDTVLLDYRFGMTKEQVLNHTQELYNKRTIKRNYNDKYYFEIQSKTNEKYKGYLIAEYYKEKLFLIGLTFSDEASNIMVFSTLSDLLKDKYGDADIMEKPVTDMNVYDRYWIRNNLKIWLSTGITNAVIQYIDLRYEKLKQLADSTEKANSEKEIKSNL